MLLHYSREDKVRVDMREYIKMILNDLSEDYSETAIPPLAKYLFKVNPKL